jgi:hypothetical protein
MDGHRHAGATLAAWLKMRLSNFYQKLRRPFVTIAQPARHNRAAKLNSAQGGVAKYEHRHNCPGSLKVWGLDWVGRRRFNTSRPCQAAAAYNLKAIADGTIASRPVAIGLKELRICFAKMDAGTQRRGPGAFARTARNVNSRSLAAQTARDHAGARAVSRRLLSRKAPRRSLVSDAR